MTAPIVPVMDLSAESLFLLFELACDQDLFDTSRNGGYYPALKQVCEALVIAGLGEKKTYGGVTPSRLLKHIEKES